MSFNPHDLENDLGSFRTAILSQLSIPPVSYWPLTEAEGEIAEDVGPNQRHGTIVGSPRLNVEAKPGWRAMGFDGIDDGITLTSTSIGTTFAIVARLMLTPGPTTSEGTILGESGTSRGLMVDHSGRVFGFLTDSGANSPGPSAVVQPFNRRIVVALSVSSGVPTWYVDGVAYAPAGTDLTVAAFSPNRIGGFGTRYLRGFLSDVALFSGVLTTADIATLQAANDEPCVEATKAIANMALSYLGQAKTIDDLENDQSIEAQQVRLHWRTVADHVLRDVDWSFATARAELTLVDGDADDPYSNDWTYAYREPSDLVKVRRIYPHLGTNQRMVDPKGEIPWSRSADADGGLIDANLEDAYLEYTRRPTCVAAAGDPMFRSVLARRLAFALAMPLTKDRAVQSEQLSLYLGERDVAAASNANEEQPQDQQLNQDAEWIRARGEALPARTPSRHPF